ncbi:TetR/AcrR family transcriptional regulator [Pseudomonas nitroreducens]|uniref:TetR/AcrR family transcriptional regulator n=1 Tax=Pseudomonas nitroreducens TaxID=46680 RepID=UPI0038202C0D
MPRKKTPVDALTEEGVGQREPLTRERIELEALRLIEQDGLDTFSTRRLGAALGCEAMSIYNYYPSKAHILDALVDRVLRAIPTPDRQGSPAERIRELAQHWRQMARRHARLYAWLALHRWNSRDGVGFLAEILDCFLAAGLSDEEAARGFRVLGYYLLGATLDEINGYAEGTSSLHPLSDEELQRDFPAVARAGAFFSPEHFDRTFELGLGVVLEGLKIE